MLGAILLARKPLRRSPLWRVKGHRAIATAHLARCSPARQVQGVEAALLQVADEAVAAVEGADVVGVGEEGLAVVAAAEDVEQAAGLRRRAARGLEAPSGRRT